MNLQTVMLALVSVSLATGGQLLLKSGMTGVGRIDRRRVARPLRLLREVGGSRQVVLGLGMFGASLLFWLAVVSRVPLSQAYPFVGLTYVLITLFGRFVLKERVPVLRWAGIGLIVAGILLVGMASGTASVAAGSG